MNRLTLAFLVLLAGCQVQTGDSKEEETADPWPDTSSVSAEPLNAPSDSASALMDTTAILARPAPAASDSTPSRPLPAATREERRRQALDALEDLVSRAPTSDAQGFARASALVDERVSSLGTPPPALDSLRQAAREAGRRGDRVEAAQAAAFAHRRLTTTLPENDPARLRSDALVLGALVGRALPDWEAVRSSAASLASRWALVQPATTDARVRDALAAAVARAGEGAQTQNAPLVRLAADVIVDLAFRTPAREGQASP